MQIYDKVTAEQENGFSFFSAAKHFLEFDATKQVYISTLLAYRGTTKSDLNTRISRCFSTKGAKAHGIFFRASSANQTTKWVACTCNDFA